MKHLILIIASSIVFSFNQSFAQEINAEREAVRMVIQSAYIDGLHNKGDIQNIENGFHPGFMLLGVNNNSLTHYPIYSWIEAFNKKKNEDPSPLKPEQRIVCEYLQIDVVGTAAMAKIQLKRNDVLIFTDFLLLYKFEEGWRIVSKTYFRH